MPKKVIKENLETQNLCKDGETVDDAANLPKDDFLKRWFNQHLKHANHPNELQNFGEDVKDSEKYRVLLNDLSPDLCDKTSLNLTEPNERAQKVIKDAQNYDAETTILPEDISSGNEPLNRLFTGDLYNTELNNVGDDEEYDKDLMKTYIKTINKCLCDDEDTKKKYQLAQKVKLRYLIN